MTTGGLEMYFQHGSSIFLDEDVKNLLGHQNS